jgi:hypothetical protein
MVVDLGRREELALYVAESRCPDRYDRVAVQLELGLRPLEERHSSAPAEKGA